MSKYNLEKYLGILFRDITTFGGAAFFGGVWLLILVFKEYQLGLKMALGFIIILTITVLTRIVYFKNRPNKEGYHNWVERIDASSFPSMHAARIFFFSLTLISFWDYSLSMIVFFSLLALIVSYSRIYLKKHDWWDLLGGVILGGITFWVMTLI